MKRNNEEGGEKKEEEKKKEKERKKEEKEKEICKALKFGGKCPHGKNGLRKHDKWDQCKKSHPKVCNKLLTHGARGRQGCDGQNPRMCFSSMNTKVCTREKCTYWHCKGTTFSPESGARYEAPSRSSLHEYPALPARPGRSPVRREPQEGYRPRGREEPRRWEREEMRSRGGDQDRRREEERSRGEEQERRREDERSREEKSREERKRQESASFLDLAQIVRQEVQRAILSLLPAGASGSVSGPRTPPVSPMPSWADMLSRCSTN